MRSPGNICSLPDLSGAGDDQRGIVINRYKGAGDGPAALLATAARYLLASPLATCGLSAGHLLATCR